MNEVALPAAIEPDEWLVVFHMKPATRFLSLLALGRYKHVSAMAYCAGFKAWLVYDTQVTHTRLMLIANTEEGRATLAVYLRSTVVLSIKPPRQSMGLSPAHRFGFYCVPAIKHLLGLKCVAVRPDALYRQILRNGGVVIDNGRRAVTTADSGRP